MGLSTSAERAIEQLIERWDLHSNLTFSVPVSIRQVVRDEGWILQYRENLGTGVYGYAVILDPVRIMVISADISNSWQRHTMAHELGHTINGDTSSIHLCRNWPWMENDEERRASLAAAKILIPDSALTEIGSVDEIARLCDVPLDLVHLRLEYWGG